MVYHGVMSDLSGTADNAGVGSAEAQAQAARETKRRLVAKLGEDRQAHEEARDRAKEARDRFERTAALVASEHPEREDWFAFPGVVPREELLREAGLTAQQLHRLMAHQHHPGTTRRARP
jgi:multidrug resistance efflux pump